MIEIKINNNNHIAKDVKFAKLNKNETLDEYKQLCENDGYNLEDVIIKKIIILNETGWNDITNTFLNDLTIWEEIGGYEYIGNDQTIINYEGNFWELSEEKVQEFMKNGLTPTVMVINEKTQETIFVNTEGYNYARYVGIGEIK